MLIGFAKSLELLELAGAAPVFIVSAFTGEGIDELMAFLQEEPEVKR